MTPEEEQRMNELCERIQTEKDPEKFDQLVQALNDLLAVEETPDTARLEKRSIRTQEESFLTP